MNSSKGYVTLLSVIVVSAVGTAVAVSLLFLGANSAKTIIVVESSQKAKAIANACAEVALGQIRSNTSFTGTSTLSLDGGSCVYGVQNTGGNNRAISTTSTVGSAVRKVQITINQLTPTIRVSSSQEVAD